MSTLYVMTRSHSDEGEMYDEAVAVYDTRQGVDDDCMVLNTAVDDGDVALLQAMDPGYDPSMVGVCYTFNQAVYRRK